jgi:hypothetical protein
MLAAHVRVLQHRAQAERRRQTALRCRPAFARVRTREQPLRLPPEPLTPLPRVAVLHAVDRTWEQSGRRGPAETTVREGLQFLKNGFEERARHRRR